MTVAGRAATAARPVSRRAGSIVYASLLALLVLVGTRQDPARARGAQTAPRASLLQLVSQSPSIEPGGEFQARVRVTSAPAGAVLDIKVHDRTATRSSFEQTIAGKGFAAAISTTTLPIQPDASGSVLVASAPSTEG
ncbi:MAG: hypothetical protein ACR2LQ_07480, partial [Acidimicrobiales bacterium]